MKTTELFVEQTLTGFLILTAGAAPFLSWETLGKLPEEAKGGIDISSAAGAIGAAYLLGVVFDRFADTLLERSNRWNRLLFAIELKEENKALSPDDPFPEDQLQNEVIHQGDEAWEWMDYLRSRIRVARAMAAFVPTLTLSMELTVGLRDRPGMVQAVLGIIVAAYIAAFLASQILERSSRRLPKTYDLHTDEDCRGARAKMKATREPAFWLGVFLLALGVGLIPFGSGSGRVAMAVVLTTGAVLTGHFRLGLVEDHRDLHAVSSRLPEVGAGEMTPAPGSRTINVSTDLASARKPSTTPSLLNRSRSIRLGSYGSVTRI